MSNYFGRGGASAVADAEGLLASDAQIESSQSPIVTENERYDKWTAVKVVGSALALIILTSLALFQNAEFLYSMLSAEEASEYELMEYVEELDFEDVKAVSIPKTHKVKIGDESDDVDGEKSGEAKPGKPEVTSKPLHTVGHWSGKPLLPAGCDIFDGKWVKDAKMGKPNYKRLATCRIEARWNCHDLYGVPQEKRMSHEEYRWQPNHCDMPTLAEIASALKSDMRILVVGDSLLYNQFLSLRCLLGYNWKIFGDWQIDFYRDNFLLKCAQGQDFIASGKGTRDIYLNECSPLINSTDTLDYDVLLMGTGHHYSIPPGVVYHPEDASKPSEAIYYTISTVHDTLRTLNFKGVTVWQGYTPRHFQSSKGAAANKFSGGACKTGNTLDYNMDDILVKKFEDATEKALKKVGAGIKLLNITRLTMPRRDAHPGPGGEKGHGMDCTHFCLPGIPDDWNLMFLASLPEWMAEHGREATKL